MNSPVEIQKRTLNEYGENRETSRILFKGTWYGIRIVLPDDKPEEDLLEEGRLLLPEAVHAIGDLGVTIDCRSRRITPDFLAGLLCVFVWPGDFQVLSWLSDDTETIKLLRNTGFSTGEPPSGRIEREGPEPHTLLLKQSLRSGQMLEHDGDVTLLGHVNEGAEIRASGNIFVHGRLKGVAHAGTRGGNFGVWAEHFEATQVRIGGKICSSLGREKPWWGKAVQIALENDHLVARELKLDSAS